MCVCGGCELVLMCRVMEVLGTAGFLVLPVSQVINILGAPIKQVRRIITISLLHHLFTV